MAVPERLLEITLDPVDLRIIVDERPALKMQVKTAVI